jgi:glycosyltransferase involved in cell wall biosynthesis
MEKRTAGADIVLVTTDWQKEKLLELYPDTRVVKIPNGYDSEKMYRYEEVGPDSERFTILHSGMLTLGRKSRNFLEGLSIFMKRTGTGPESVHVIFAGAWESGNRDSVYEFGLQDVVDFIGHLPHHECIRLEKKSHVLLLIKHDDERYRGLIPGKLYEYIGARRPILAVVPEGEAKKIVRNLDRGETVSVSDPEDISRGLEKLYSLYREGRLESSYSLEEVSRYSRKAEAEVLNRVLLESIGDQ